MQPNPSRSSLSPNPSRSSLSPNPSRSCSSPNPSRSSSSRLSVSPHQSQQLHPQRNRRNTFPLSCSKIERFFKLMMYWLLNVSMFAALTSSLFVQNWRKIVVDRHSLKQLQRAGKIDASQLKSLIAFPRKQGIYMECFLTIYTVNRVKPFHDTNCHSFFSGMLAAPSEGNLGAILNLQTAQLFLGPLSVFLAFFGFLMALLITFVSKPNILCLRWSAFLRIVNFVVLSAFFLCAMMVGQIFKRPDPGFPVPWPSAIRNHSHVYTFEGAASEWFISIVLQSGLVFFDLFLLDRHGQPPLDLENLGI